MFEWAWPVMAPGMEPITRVNPFISGRVQKLKIFLTVSPSPELPFFFFVMQQTQTRDW